MLFSHQKFKDFSRTFQDPTLYFDVSRTFLYTNLATTKQNVWVEAMFWVKTHANTEMLDNESLKTCANQTFAVH